MAGRPSISLPSPSGPLSLHFLLLFVFSHPRKPGLPRHPLVPLSCPHLTLLIQLLKSCLSLWSPLPVRPVPSGSSAELPNLLTCLWPSPPLSGFSGNLGLPWQYCFFLSGGCRFFYLSLNHARERRGRSILYTVSVPYPLLPKSLRSLCGPLSLLVSHLLLPPVTCLTPWRFLLRVLCPFLQSNSCYSTICVSNPPNPLVAPILLWVYLPPSSVAPSHGHALGPIVLDNFSASVALSGHPSRTTTPILLAHSVRFLQPWQPLNHQELQFIGICPLFVVPPDFSPFPDWSSTVITACVLATLVPLTLSFSFD